MRPRFWNGRAITPAKTRAYELIVGFSAKRDGIHMVKFPSEVAILAVFSVPASWSAKKKREALEGGIPTRIDLDNIAKVVLDGGNGVAWEDDRQIKRLVVEKKYGLDPCVVVRIQS